MTTVNVARATDTTQVSPKRRKRRRSIDPEVYRRIDQLMALGRMPKEVAQTLEEEFSPERVPNIRTIQRIAAEQQPDAAPETWLTSPVGNDDELVLPVLAEVIVRTAGRRQRLTKPEAERVAQLRRAAPDIPPWRAYLLARLYVEAGGDVGVRQRLDAVVAFATWRGLESLETYIDAKREGWLPGSASNNAVERILELIEWEDALSHARGSVQALSASRGPVSRKKTSGRRVAS